MTASDYLGTWITGENRYRIELTIFGTQGNGLCGFLTGGERAHVGGVSYANPREKTNGEGITADISMICGPGHKDVYVAQMAASQICIAINEPVSITAGIHIEHASQEELSKLQENCKKTIDAFINDYKRKRSNLT